jgi:hypothetical protein
MEIAIKLMHEVLQRTAWPFFPFPGHVLARRRLIWFELPVQRGRLAMSGSLRLWL